VEKKNVKTNYPNLARTMRNYILSAFLLVITFITLALCQQQQGSFTSGITQGIPTSGGVAYYPSSTTTITVSSTTTIIPTMSATATTKSSSDASR
jgi:hypothetical protein